jgi:SAM-dependent methyltransferase
VRDLSSVLALLPVAVLLALSWGLARQLGHPRGWMGRRWMSRMLNDANRTMLDAAVEAVDARSGECIVDVGFGGGHTLERLRPIVAPRRPVGIEISEAMVDAARERWGDAVETHLADVVSLPLADASADGVISVNTLYFWPDPAAALREIRRVLRPGGRLVLGVRRPGMMRLVPITWFGFRLRSAARVQDLLRAAGFDVRVVEKVQGELTFVARVA